MVGLGKFTSLKVTVSRGGSVQVYTWFVVPSGSVILGFRERDVPKAMDSGPLAPIVGAVLVTTVFCMVSILVSLTLTVPSYTVSVSLITSDHQKTVLETVISGLSAAVIVESYSTS